MPRQKGNASTSVFLREDAGYIIVPLSIMAFGIAIFATILNNATNSNVLSFARNSFVNIKNPFVMKQFAGLVILKAQVAAYGTVFAVVALGIKVHRENKLEENIVIE